VVDLSGKTDYQEIIGRARRKFKGFRPPSYKADKLISWRSFYRRRHSGNSNSPLHARTTERTTERIGTDMTRNKIEAVIFDMDGLLLDTEIFYTEVTQLITRRFGKVFDWSVKSQMIGLPAQQSARYLVETLQLPITPEQYLEEREDLLAERFPNARAKPGARALVEHLHSNRIPQAVATSSTRALFELKTCRHDWFGYFDRIVTGDDPQVKQGKPAPDIFLTAAQRLGVEPACCLVFEDAPSGVRAALAAGMSIVAVPEPEMDKTLYHDAHQVLESLRQFQPAHWQLPDF
jgi:pseudouridine-5'-monophosphatase